MKGNSQTIEETFLVVDSTIGYNAILGGPSLNTIKPIVASYLLLMQFKMDDGKIRTLYGLQKMAKKMLLCPLEFSK